MAERMVVELSPTNLVLDTAEQEGAQERDLPADAFEVLNDATRQAQRDAARSLGEISDSVDPSLRRTDIPTGTTNSRESVRAYLRRVRDSLRSLEDALSIAASVVSAAAGLVNEFQKYHEGEISLRQFLDWIVEYVTETAMPSIRQWYQSSQEAPHVHPAPPVNPGGNQEVDAPGNAGQSSWVNSALMFLGAGLLVLGIYSRLTAISLLASGSDDQTAIIWDAVAHRTKLIHRTGHSGNIFSVKFLPHANDGLLVTAAADGEIRLHDLSRSEVIEEIRCNEKRVKRISTTPAMPYMFWSAAEDGTVRQYDLRETSSDHNRILINLRSACGSQAEVKCLSINPTQPNLLAIGCSDQYVRLFDIRKLVVRSEAQMGHPYPEDAPLHYFCPGHLNEQISHKRMRRYRQFAVTYVTWSLDGRELLVNLGSEQVYLYDLCDIRRPVHFSRDDKCDDLPSETSVVEPMSDRALQLKVEGNTAFKEEKYSKAIYLYSEAMIHSPKQPVLHANRAAAYLKRQWYGDVYAALKDCYTALSFDPSNHKAHLRQANCLLQLKWHNLAKECIQQFQQRFPTRAAKSQELAKAIEEDANKSSRSKDSTNGSDAEHSNTTETEFQRTAVDFKYHYCGHCNTTTDIKEASFFGGQSQYIAAGSDDGHCFIWEKDTTRLAQVINGDESIVNCVQPHPSQLLLATSGIDPVIRLWSPHSHNYNRTVGYTSSKSEADKSEVATIEKIAADNQKRMRSDPLEIMLMNMGMRFGPVGGGESGDEEEAAVHCRPS